MNSEQKRKLLEAAFEPHGDGYVFYRDNFTRGVPVSPEERESYLKTWSVSSTGAFYNQIKGRTPVTRARGFGGTKVALRVMPTSFAIGCLTFGTIAALTASRSEVGWIQAGEYALSALLLTFGAGALVFGQTGRRRGR